MKNLTLILILQLGMIGSAFAANFNSTYSEQAYEDYLNAKNEAVKTRDAIQAFLADTTETNLQTAKQVWTEARKVYSVTEIYRFYGGPIDGEEGPEGLINAWPLDEAYIDYVKGRPNSGIINQASEYPEITKDLLVELNEKDGEKNISTGWHAIEFLLWGQDFNINAPGDRPVSDFQVGVGQNAERRRAYLSIISDLLVEHLDEVVVQWEKSNSQSFYNTFVNLDEKDALTKAFTSLVSMSSDELAIERMFVAYDTQFQEDEHSCFSDTTNFDLLYNYRGVKNLWTMVKNTNEISEALVQEIDAIGASVENELVNFKGPFDQAIFEPEGRKQIIFIVNNLQTMGEKFKEAAKELGITL